MPLVVGREPTQFDAGSFEDRLSIAAIQSEESPNCGYAVEYTPCAAKVKTMRRGFGLVTRWFGTSAFLRHRHHNHNRHRRVLPGQG
jgi:hypothetical protein